MQAVCVGFVAERYDFKVVGEGLLIPCTDVFRCRIDQPDAVRTILSPIVADAEFFADVEAGVPIGIGSHETNYRAGRDDMLWGFLVGEVAPAE